MFVQRRGDWSDRVRILYIARFREDKAFCVGKNCATCHVEYQGKIARVMRTRQAVLICCAIGLGVAVAATAADPADPRARIPHLDGSGRATIVEIEPGVPGRNKFLRATPEPIPKPGELILSSRASPAPSPSPQPR